MTMLRARTLPALLLASLITAAGCSRHDPAPHAVAAPSRYVAVARGRIDIEGGLLPLSSTQPGVIDRVIAHAGEHVRTGQVLARLRSADAHAAVTIAKGHLAQARAEAKLDASRLDAARKRAKTLAEAAAAGAGAGQNATDAADQVQQLEARQAAAQAAVTVAQGRLDEARHALDQHTLKAPVSALVTEVHVQPGETVSSQSGPMFTLLPDSPRIVVAELSSDFASRVHAGMHAQVVLDNDTEPTVGDAHVVRVGQVFGPSTLEEDPSLRANTRTVKCVLHFDKPASLRIGQRVLVRILPGPSAGKSH